MGFWSTLGSVVGDIGGSFIGDPLLGNQAVGLIGALAGGSGSSGATAGQLPVSAGNPYNSPAVQEGLDTLDTSKKYFNGVLNGSQEQAEGLLGPEVSTVLGQYDNAAKTAAELGPRGGGRTAILAEAPFKKAAAYGTALAGAKSTALSELPKIGSEEASIGNQQDKLNNDFQLGQAGINANPQNKNILTGQAAQAAQLAQLGKGIGGILTNVITGNKAGSDPANGSGFGQTSTSVVGNSNNDINSQYAAGF